MNLNSIAAALEEVARSLRHAQLQQDSLQRDRSQTDTASAVGSAEFEVVEEAPRPFRGKDIRFYCVWIAADGKAEIVLGEYPAVWKRVLAKGGEGCKELAGSGLRLKAYASLELAQANWIQHAPGCVKSSLPAVAPLCRVYTV